MHDPRNVGSSSALLEERCDGVRQQPWSFKGAKDSSVIVEGLDGHGYRAAARSFVFHARATVQPFFIDNRHAYRTAGGNSDKGANVHAHAREPAKRRVRELVDAGSSDRY